MRRLKSLKTLVTPLSSSMLIGLPPRPWRRLRRHQRRWLVERFFSWIQWHRRILIRWEYYIQNFLGFVQLACALILLKQC